MEKLIELHRQFLEETGKSMIIYSDGGLWYFYCLDTTYDHTEGAIQYLISKEYGFIKRLVEKDKIDYEKVRRGEGNGSRRDFETVQPEYFMLMLLSIQEEPVSFLIDILK